MDPELRKLLQAAHAAGASDEDLGHLIDRWNADHAQASVPQPQFRPGDEPHGPVDISRQLQAQVDAQQARSKLPGYMQAAPTLGQAGRQLGEEVINFATGIPGAKGILAKVRASSRNEPYAQAYDDINALTGELPKSHQIVGRTLGAATVFPLLPENPAIAGAVLGGADQALSGQPGVSMRQRGVNTAVGAGAGYLGGRLLENVGTAARSYFAPTVGKAKLDQLERMAATDAVNYGAALDEGMTREATPQIKALLENPDFDAIASSLEQYPVFRGMDRTDPRFLDQIYKSLSDKGVALEKGLAQFDPSQPNTKRAAQAAVKTLKGQLLDAMSSPGVKPAITFNVPAETHAVEPQVTELGHEQAFGHVLPGTANEYAASPTTHGQLVRDFPNVPQRQGPAGPAFNLKANPGHVQPGVEVQAPAMRVQTAPAKQIAPMMPSYPEAVQAHAENVQLGKAFDRGYLALKKNASKGGVPLNQATKLSPEALQLYLKDASPATRQEVVNGVLARLQQEPKTTKLVFPSKALRTASDFARTANAPNQGMIDFLTRLGVLGANSAGGPP